MTLELVLDYATWACLMLGSAFIFIGALGIMRLPDVFTRMHGAGIIDTLGTGLILLGLMFQIDHALIAVKLVLIGLFIYFTSPTTSFALARAICNAGFKPWLPEGSDQLPGGGCETTEEADQSKT